MGPGTSAGLLGLTANTGKREQARNDIATLEKMNSLKKAEEAEEQQAAIREQEYHAKITAEADKLLSGDKRRIIEKAKLIQKETSAHIKNFGGSRAAFMKNGGLTMIGNYSSQILDSEELQVYRENQTNLKKLIEAKDKGFGHRISPKDLKSMEDYETNGKGVISYTGLMDDIEIPKSNLFDYNHIMTPQEILATGSNKVKLTANYMKEIGDDLGQGLPDDETLRSYIQYKGYSGRGSYHKPQYTDGSRGKSGKSSGKYQDPNKVKKHTYAGLVYQGMKEPSVNLNDISSLPESHIWNSITGLRTQLPNGKAKRSVGQSIVGALDYVLPGSEHITGEFVDSTYKMKGGKPLGKDSSESFFNLENGEGNYTIEDGKILDVDISQMGSMFDAAGTSINENENDNYSNQDLKFSGVIVGYKSSIKGKNVLIMDATFDDGSIDEDTNKDMYDMDPENPTESQRVLVNSFIGDDGHTYYQEVQYDTARKASKLALLMGESNNLLDELTEETQKQGFYDEAKENAELKKIAQVGYTADENGDVEGNFNYGQTLNSLNSTVFNMQNRDYNADPNGSSRSNLRKAYYLAKADLAGTVLNSNYDVEDKINSNEFKVVFEESLGMRSFLRNQGLSDKDLLNRALQKMNVDTNQEESRNNKLFIMKLQNHLNKLNGI